MGRSSRVFRFVDLFAASIIVASSLAGQAGVTSGGPLSVTSVSGMKGPAAKTESVRIALNWKPEPQFGGFYAARRLDIDKQNGLELDSVPGGAGTPVGEMVAAGQYDFGIASADEVIISRARGSDVIALFASFQVNPQAIMTREERGFRSLEEVFRNEGTVAMQKGLPYAVYLSRKYGSSIRAAIVPYVGGISNFLADAKHSQQCFVTSEPLLETKQGKKVRTFLVAESGFNPYTTVLITRRSILDKRPELVKSLVKTVRSGWERYLSEPLVVDQKMNELNPSIDLETFRASGLAQRGLILLPNSKGAVLGQMTKERWSKLSEQLRAMKMIETAPHPESLFINL